VWDLSESLAELYERDQRREAAMSARSSTDAGDSTSPKVDVASWLVADPGNGFIRVFAPGGAGTKASRLVPTTLTTTAHKICLQLGVPGTSLHVQLAGESLRRLEPHEQPLAIQNDYLATLGYSSVAAMQAEGISEDLVYLVKFYSGISGVGGRSDTVGGDAGFYLREAFQSQTHTEKILYNEGH